MAAIDIERVSIPGVLVIRLRRFPDDRGFFIERFSAAAFREAGLPMTFVQDNHSRSKPRVVRGLHYQTDPAQGKLVGVIRGRIWDVVVDVRPGSPTFGKSYDIELGDDDERCSLIWIPAGLAHGFCVLGNESADVLYKVDQPYSAATEGGILWSDPELAIRWPVAQPIVSARDQALQTFAQYREQPPRWSQL